MNNKTAWSLALALLWSFRRTTGGQSHRCKKKLVKKARCCVVKNRHFECHITQHPTLHFEPPEGGIFAASDSCFGYGIKKLQKAIQDKLRDLDDQIVQSLTYSMSGDDQRRIAFCSTHNNVFANSFRLTLAPDPSMRFNLPEFTVAMARNFGDTLYTFFFKFHSSPMLQKLH